MKVLHLISSGGMYGAEAVILGLLRRAMGAPESAACLGVFHHAGTAEPEVYRRACEEGLPATLVACEGQLDLRVPARLRALVYEQGIDVVHAHGYKADIYVAAAFVGRRRPVLVSTCHTWYDNDLAVRLYGALDRVVLRGFDEVAAVSDQVREQLLQAGVSPAHVHLVRNGLDISPFHRRSHGSLSGERLRVGLAGRLAREKGVDLFLQAALLVARRHPESDFFVAGDGPDRAALMGSEEALQLGGRLVFLGRPPGMPDFYASLDVLVSASRQEGLPMVLLEGMACSLPIVATQVGEVPRVVQDGVTGLLVPAERPAALAAATGELLADTALRQRLGEAGRARVVSEFSLDRMAGEYEELYSRALRRRQANPAAQRRVVA